MPVEPELGEPFLGLRDQLLVLSDDSERTQRERQQVAPDRRVRPRLVLDSLATPEGGETVQARRSEGKAPGGPDLVALLEGPLDVAEPAAGESETDGRAPKARRLDAEVRRGRLQLVRAPVVAGDEASCS